MSWFFGCEAYGILASQPGIKPIPPALEGKVLTTGLPGKSPGYDNFLQLCNYQDSQDIEQSTHPKMFPCVPL